jgi:3,4-dihydroxy 2-butanone 4-phosphate synthase/GTP cyclohydrolase II
MSIASTEEILADYKAGKMVILIDEEDRENEGDLVLAADFVTPEAINFMARFGRGLICLTLTEERCKQLQLPQMARNNGTRMGTAFTQSIEAADGVTTGISAADRAHTIRVAVAKGARPEHLVQPGHVFPIMARDGGVLMRAGHTEAGCDLGSLTGLTPASVICEIMKDDGTMARLPDLIEFAREHGLKIGTIVDLIHYRSANESLIERLQERSALTPWGEFRQVLYRDKPSGAPHLAMVFGDVRDGESLVRVHEPLSVLDALDAKASTHSWPLPAALQAIAQHGRGVAVLLNCGAGATDSVFEQFSQLCHLDAAPEDRKALLARSSKMDLRTYGIGAQVLKDLQVRRMRLLSTPRKMPSMGGFGLEVTGFEAPAGLGLSVSV